MSVRTAARLRLAVGGPPYDMANPIVGGMLKSLGERSVVTQRRRIMIGDVGGARRPQSFLNSANESNGHCSRRKMVSRLRKLERKVLIVQGLVDFFVGWMHSFQRFNPFNNYCDQVRVTVR